LGYLEAIAGAREIRQKQIPFGVDNKKSKGKSKAKPRAKAKARAKAKQEQEQKR
jgi:hypothetical protein